MVTVDGRASVSLMHVITWRAGRPTVVTFGADRIAEIAAVEFDDDQRAIAYLATLSRWR